MSDLNDELRHLADEAARQAQPLPVTDVIRQGDRRYRPAVTVRPLRRAPTPGLATQARPRRRWPGWVAPLAAAGAVIAVVAGTAAVSGAIHGRRAAAGASPAHRVIAYVADAGSGMVIPIRTATNTALPPIKAGRAPDVIAITPDGKTAYVAIGSFFYGTHQELDPIQTATGKMGTPIPFANPYDLAMAPDGKTLYVLSTGPAGYGGTVTPIHTATNTAGRPIEVADQQSNPVGFAVTPDGEHVYVLVDSVVSCDGSVIPIRKAAGQAQPAIPAGGLPHLIAITPDGKTAYVVTYTCGAGSYTVTPIATATSHAGQPIQVRYATAITVAG